MCPKSSLVDQAVIGSSEKVPFMPRSSLGTRLSCTEDVANWTEVVAVAKCILITLEVFEGACGR